MIFIKLYIQKTFVFIICLRALSLLLKMTNVGFLGAQHIGLIEALFRRPFCFLLICCRTKAKSKWKGLQCCRVDVSVSLRYSQFMLHIFGSILKGTIFSPLLSWCSMLFTYGQVYIVLQCGQAAEA